MSAAATPHVDRLGRGARLTGIDSTTTRPYLRPADEAVRRPSTSLVIPTLNEAKNVGWVLERIPSWVEEVVLVDGRSTDGTVDVAREIRPDLTLVEERTPGKGAALRAGLYSAACEVVAIIDADGSMDPAELDRYVDGISQGYDLVKGSRFMAGGGSTDITPIRRLGNLALVELVNRLYRSSFTDLCYGYLAFRRGALRSVRVEGNGFEVETELVVRSVMAGLRIAEVPSMEAPRLTGESNLNPVRDGTRALRTLLRTRFSMPLPEAAEIIDLRDEVLAEAALLAAETA